MFTLTPEQRQALDLLEAEFTADRPHVPGRVFQINGPAGTGKTELIRCILESDWVESATVCAPTHKACKVLQDRLGHGAEIVTCHKFLCAQERYDADGKMIWAFSPPAVLPDLIILDEVSMVGSELFGQFRELVETRGAFLVTTGDACQLPPVEDDLVVTPFYDSNAGYPIRVSLTRNVRNTRKSFNTCLNQLRKYILSPETAPSRVLDVCQYLSAYVIAYAPQYGRVTARDVPNDILAEFARYPDAILLAHRTNARNNTVSDLNLYVRRRLFGDTVTEAYVPGDRLILTDYYRFDETTVLHTNDLVTVEAVETTRCDYYYETYLAYRITVTGDVVVHVVHPDDLDRWQAHDKRVREDLRLDADLRRLNDEQRSNAWKQYYQRRKEIHAPIDYAYCVSIHKSQGSTYPVAFVFLSDFAWLLSSSKNLENRRLFYKLLYVGLSRSKTHAYVF